MKGLNVVGKILLGINAACLALVFLAGVLTIFVIIGASEELSFMFGQVSMSELLWLCLLLLLVLPLVLLVINLLGIFTKTHLGVTALLCLPMILCILMLTLGFIPEFRESLNQEFRGGISEEMAEIKMDPELRDSLMEAFREGFDEGFRESYGADVSENDIAYEIRESFLEGFDEGFRKGYEGGDRSEINGYIAWLVINIYMVISYALPVVVRLVRRFRAGPKQSYPAYL